MFTQDSRHPLSQRWQSCLDLAGCLETAAFGARFHVLHASQKLKVQLYQTSKPYANQIKNILIIRMYIYILYIYIHVYTLYVLNYIILHMVPKPCENTQIQLMDDQFTWWRDGMIKIKITRTSIAIAYSRHIDLYRLITNPSNPNVNHIPVMFG